PPRLSKIRSRIPRELDRLIFRMIEKNPRDRYSSMADVCSDLKSIGARSAKKFRVKPRQIGAAAGALLIVAATWLGLPYVDNVRHPLPTKRFVALMAWPTNPNSAHLAVLRGTLDSIGVRLARAELSTKDFMIISTADVAGQSSLRTPTDAVSMLGANLVLAASI